jgi:hypothetical protein
MTREELQESGPSRLEHCRSSEPGEAVGGPLF